MAFHAFGFFRKRMKLFLAILTVFTMFIFILQVGGKGDPFDSLMRAFGGGRGVDNTQVTTLYSKKITVSDIEQLRRNRTAADVFIQRAIAPLYLPPSRLMQQIMQGQQLAGLDKDQQNKLFSALLQANFFGQAQGDYAKLNHELVRLKAEFAAQENKTEGVKTIQRIINGTGLEQWVLAHRGDLYFGGNLSTEGLLDFLVWQKQADRMNITLTDTDVRKLVNSEADHTDVLTGDPTKDADKMAAYLTGLPRRPTTDKAFLDALRAEFRVRLAQEALLGSTPGARAALGAGYGSDQLPAGSTPEQFFDFYKDRRTTLDVAFLKLPVSQFTGQVKDQPTEAELKKLYERSKDDEPNPVRERPGIKVPQRIKVEWISADSDDPYYRKRAGEALQVLNGAGAVAQALMTAASPGGIPPHLASFGVAATPDLAEQVEYQKYTADIYRSGSWWDASNVTPAGNNPYAIGLRRPDTVASVVGQALGAAGTAAPLWSARVALAGNDAVRLAEQKMRAVGITLAGANPFVPAILANEAALVTVPVPKLDEVRATMAARARDRLAPDMARGALATFTKELDAKHFNPKDAKEYVDKNANQEHGITAHGAMTEARDVFSLADAKALAPLRQAEEGSVPLTQTRLLQFAASFFSGNQQLYHPQQFSGGVSNNTNYYYWLTESDKAYVPSFDEARPKVVEAWKFQKARKLAEDEAQRIIDAVTHRPEGISPDRFLKDEAARKGYETFERLDIAKLITVPTPQAMASTQYKPFTFTETQFRFPRPDVLDKLFLDLKEPGDSTVLKDRPDRNDYVAVLTKKPTVPSEDSFFRVYEAAGRTFLGDNLWAMFQSERADQFRNDLLKQLRGESRAPLDDQGNYRIDPEVRKRLSTGSNDSEE